MVFWKAVVVFSDAVVGKEAQWENSQLSHFFFYLYFILLTVYLSLLGSVPLCSNFRESMPSLSM